MFTSWNDKLPLLQEKYFVNTAKLFKEMFFA